MKVFFNTKTFDQYIKGGNIEITLIPAQAELLVLGAQKVDYSAFTKLRAVYRFGVGDENVDYLYLKERDIPVYFPSARAKEILFSATADFTVYGILSLLYAGSFGDINTWKKYQRAHLANKTALVIGLGNIGRKVADKLTMFMKVLTYDVLYNKLAELEEMTRVADVITIHVPLTSETKNFFDDEKLSWVKNNALLINTARGELFDEQALYDKLTRTDCRAFFDVFWQEPYTGKLKSLGKDKFFMTPHSASNTKEFIQEGFNDILKIIAQKF